MLYLCRNREMVCRWQVCCFKTKPQRMIAATSLPAVWVNLHCCLHRKWCLQSSNKLTRLILWREQWCCKHSNQPSLISHIPLISFFPPSFPACCRNLLILIGTSFSLLFIGTFSGRHHQSAKAFVGVWPFCFQSATMVVQCNNLDPDYRDKFSKL